MGSTLHYIGIGACLLGNLAHHGDKTVDSVLALVFGGLDHERLVEEQREIDCRGMISIIEKTLCHVHGGDTGGFVAQTVEDKLMLAQSLDGQEILILERLLDIVGIESGKRSHQLHILATESEDIGEGTKQHTEVAVVWSYGNLSAVSICKVDCLDICQRTGSGCLRKELLQSGTHTNRSSTWSTATMGSGECLMKIDVHNVESHIARAACSKHRVEVGSIIVHQSAALMHEFGYLGNLLFKHSEGIGIGHHHCCHGIVEDATQVVDIHKTLCSALNLYHLKSAYCS